MHIYDLIIIGGGPSGINCAISAKEQSLDFLLIEKGLIANSIYHFPTNMTFFSTSQKLEIGKIPFIAHGDKPTRREALEYYRRLVESYELPIKLYEPVSSMMPSSEEDTYEIRTSKGVYHTRHVVVATGFYDIPRPLNVPGEELPKVKHYYDDAHPYIGQKILVVGAGNSACDVALETWYKGAEVTLVIRKDHIKPTVKYWIRPNIENRIKEGSIPTFFNSTVKEIREKEVDLNTPEGVVTIENDFVLAMTGYQPNYPLLEKLGLPIAEDEDRLPVHDPETLETPLPGVFLAGVLCAGMQTSKLFIENTRHHGEVIAEQIARRSKVETV